MGLYVLMHVFRRSQVALHMSRGRYDGRRARGRTVTCRPHSFKSKSGGGLGLCDKSCGGGAAHLGALQEGDEDVGQPEAARAGGLAGDVQRQQRVRDAVRAVRRQVQVPVHQRLHALVHRRRAVQAAQQLQQPEQIISAVTLWLACSCDGFFTGYTRQ